MNELQDAICDRLVGATIAPGWEDGLLEIACGVVGPGSRLRGTSKRKRHTHAADTLGWPRMLAMALYGASSVLDDEEDRRALGIALFREFAPRDKRKRESTRLNRETLIWAATRVHPLACPGPCSLHEVVGRLAAEFHEVGKTLAREQFRKVWGTWNQCPGYTGAIDAAIQLTSTPGHHAFVVCSYLMDALAQDQPAHPLAYGTREAARVEAKVNGVAGAVEFCRELAKRLGM